MQTGPVTLSGKHVRLEPLQVRHAEGLLAVGCDERVWTHLARPKFSSLDDARDWIGKAIKDAESGGQIPFAILDSATGREAGTTRYLNISSPDRLVEIGWTWLGVDYWRTALNTECKYLLLRHAFETWKCVRVQLKTDLRNERSQRAIERLGAQREGVLRKYQLTQGNRHRDTVMYSIIDDEWPGIKARLETKLTSQAGKA
jgi:RimJ/RimL family protein N-acetyltransferase